MRQEHKDEAAVLVHRIARAAGTDNFVQTMRGPLYSELAELVRAIAREDRRGDMRV
jgi:hypothetical protein